MKAKNACLLGFVLLVTSFATAQIPCTGTITQRATLSASWPQYRFDAGHTGCNPYETALSTATVGELVLDWTYLADFSPYGDPVVANGVVYFTPGRTLYALNAVNGAPLWKYEAGIPIISAPVVVNGVVYVGVDLEDGHFRGGVYAFNAATGALLWQNTTLGIVASAPAIANGVLYVGDIGGKLTALNASSGAFLWGYRTRAQYEIEYSPAVANGVIYFTSAYFTDHQSEFPVTLYALNAATRQVIWQYDWDDAINGMPVVGGGKVYFNSVAFDANTGAVKWQTTTTRPFFSIPALANGVLYVGCFDNNFYALNANTGEVKWQYRPGDSVSASPAIANGVVYVESNDGNLYAFDAATGAVLWQHTISNYHASGPAVVNGRVYIGSQDSNLYAFHLPGH
jgi:outer membrane protein assembly factor BamB